MHPDVELATATILARGVDSLGFVELVEEVQRATDRRSRTSRSPRRTSARSTRSRLRRAQADSVSARTSRGLRAAAIRDPDRVALVTRRANAHLRRARPPGGRVRRRPAGARGRSAAIGSRSCCRTASTAAIAIYGVAPRRARPSRRSTRPSSARSSDTCSPTRGPRRCSATPTAPRRCGPPWRCGPEVPVVTDVEALAEAGGEPPTRPVSVDLAAVIYTSGSTGDPKGVTLTHANMTFAADSIIEYLGMEPSDIVLCMLPLSFDYGLYQLLMCTRLGATLVLEPDFAFPGRIVQLLESERVTGLPGRSDRLSGAALAARARRSELPAPAFPDQHRSGAARADRGGDPPHLPQRPPLLDVRADGVQARRPICPRTSSPRVRPRSASRSRAPRPGSRTPTATVLGPGEVGELMIRGAT